MALTSSRTVASNETLNHQACTNPPAYEYEHLETWWDSWHRHRWKQKVHHGLEIKPAGLLGFVLSCDEYLQTRRREEPNFIPQSKVPFGGAMWPSHVMLLLQLEARLHRVDGRWKTDDWRREPITRP